MRSTNCSLVDTLKNRRKFCVFKQSVLSLQPREVDFYSILILKFDDLIIRKLHTVKDSYKIKD